MGERVNLKVNSFDSEADSFDLTGSGLEDIQVGNACWKLFCLEHDIQPSSGILPEKVLLQEWSRS